MRVIAGIYKGKKLKSPETVGIRPTLDRVKESIFNVIQFKITGAQTLDLFSGSGAMGIEAVSRQSEEVIFNDISPEASLLIRENCQNTGFTPIIYSLDYKGLLDKFAVLGKKFDIVFIDPPYEGDTGLNAVKILFEKGLLNSGGVAVYEHSASLKTDYSGLNNITTKSKKYGKVCVDFIYNNA